MGRKYRNCAVKQLGILMGCRESGKSLQDRRPHWHNRACTLNVLNCACVCNTCGYMCTCTHVSRCTHMCMHEYAHVWVACRARDPATDRVGPAGTVYRKHRSVCFSHSRPVNGRTRGWAAPEMHRCYIMDLRQGQRWRARRGRGAARGLCRKQEMKKTMY